MRMMSFARLMRVSNVFTAMADVWAGFFLVQADLVEVYDVGRLPALLLASACIYSAGMVFNDVFDVERDREIHPARPLPSGEVSVRSAVIFGALLHAVGLASAATAGLFPALTTAAVIGLTFAYNGWLKRYRITGSVTMGACRFGNMLLGMSPSLLILPLRLIFPGFLAIYVLVVTLISTLEESERPRGPFTALLAFELVVIGALGAYLYSSQSHYPAADELATLAGKVLGALALWILVTAIGALRRPNRSSIGQVVRVSLMGIIVFDAAMLIGTGQLHWAKMLVLFLIPTYLLGRMLPRPRPSGGRVGPSIENRPEYCSDNGDVPQ